eukprot:CAMPEP_0202701254 /NCGR_PEP_ID=MMETSP1385-20130828/14350_1 /ASSEMBLY_ACC=CAM_ASM_000861 /TAXON_ID=933848 /ORGANISM="Elphidium margaritaceum" /LENGTH=546 /DNA_ID=CAMNT_0049358629 /DNA_START=103 /DNA_END=1743 /DNA_ORIENTATION=-
MSRIIGGSLLLYAFSLSDGYYLSPNYLDFFQAQAFCSDVCNSNLAGIFDYFRMDAAAHTMELQNIEVYGNSENLAWIGLDGSTIDSDGQPTEWIGGEPVEFASDFAATLQNGECGQILTVNSTNTTFVSASCATLARPLCNSCDGFVEKYALIAELTSAEDAESACLTGYGTTVASVRSSDKDMADILALQSISGNPVIWLGLFVQNETDIEWLDGSMVEYGAEGISGGDCDPWDSGNTVTADTQCAVVNSDGCWEAVDCASTTAYVLCRKPSELEGDGLNVWSASNNTAVDNSTGYYVLRSDLLTGDDGEPYATLDGKRWLNEGEPFELELTFEVQESAPYLQAVADDLIPAEDYTVFAGVYLILDRWCAEAGWLWVGIDRGFGYNYTSFAVEGGEGSYVWETEFVDGFSDAVDHVLTVSVTPVGNHSVVSAALDGQAYFTGLEVQYTFPHDSWSPLIGLWSNGGLIFTSKSLYVSGSPYWAANCSHFEFNATGTTTTEDMSMTSTTEIAEGTDTTLPGDGTDIGHRNGILCVVLYLAAILANIS